MAFDRQVPEIAGIVQLGVVLAINRRRAAASSITPSGTDLSLTIAAMFVLAMLARIVCLLLSSRDLPGRLDPALRAGVR